MSRNTVLTLLDCSNSNISSLDISKNTSLVDLDCGWSNLSTAMLITIFNEFAKRDGKNLLSNGNGQIHVAGNLGVGGEGYAGAKATVEAQNWYVVDRWPIPPISP